MCHDLGATKMDSSSWGENPDLLCYLYFYLPSSQKNKKPILSNGKHKEHNTVESWKLVAASVKEKKKKESLVCNKGETPSQCLQRVGHFNPWQDNGCLLCWPLLGCLMKDVLQTSVISHRRMQAARWLAALSGESLCLPVTSRGPNPSRGHPVLSPRRAPHPPSAILHRRH